MFCPYISLNINEIFCTFEQKIIDFICSSSSHKMQHQLANWEGIPKKKKGRRWEELWDEIVSQRERFFLCGTGNNAQTT